MLLALIMATAMVINLLAALTGILVPLTLDHFDIDPATASDIDLPLKISST